MIEDSEIVFWNQFTMIVSGITACERYSLPKRAFAATITQCVQSSSRMVPLYDRDSLYTEGFSTGDD